MLWFLRFHHSDFNISWVSCLKAALAWDALSTCRSIFRFAVTTDLSTPRVCTQWVDPAAYLKCPSFHLSCDGYSFLWMLLKTPPFLSKPSWKQEPVCRSQPQGSEVEMAFTGAVKAMQGLHWFVSSMVLSETVPIFLLTSFLSVSITHAHTRLKSTSLHRKKDAQFINSFAPPYFFDLHEEKARDLLHLGSQRPHVHIIGKKKARESDSWKLRTMWPPWEKELDPWVKLSESTRASDLGTSLFLCEYYYTAISNYTSEMI